MRKPIYSKGVIMVELYSYKYHRIDILSNITDFSTSIVIFSNYI